MAKCLLRIGFASSTHVGFDPNLQLIGNSPDQSKNESAKETIPNRDCTKFELNLILFRYNVENGKVASSPMVSRGASSAITAIASVEETALQIRNTSSN
jgi:hypothetical protein